MMTQPFSLSLSSRAPIGWLLVILLCAIKLDHRSLALDNGLALRPPMGWLAWERFVCETNCQLYPGECIDERLFREMAARLVEDGYLAAGYTYLNIDDCWSTRERNNRSMRLEPDPSRFPNGIKKLADHVHGLGLQLGIYGDCGTETCQLFPGQLKHRGSLEGNYFELDASSFADWQVDSFKFDGCYLEVPLAAQICPSMGLALNKTGRPMLFSCSWPAYENDERLPTNWSLVAERCNLWRAFGDIEDSWRSVGETIDYFVRQQELVVKWHGPGHWFDADQLVIGNFGLSLEQEQAQMAVWSIWAAPLYMSNDLRSIGKESAELLRNKWIIDVNQDKFGIFGLMVQNSSYLQAFVKPIEPVIGGCPSYAIVYLDRRTLGNGRIARFPLSTLIGRVHEMLVNATGQWTEWTDCANRIERSFVVRDLIDHNSVLSRHLSLTGNLELRVNLSGVRMVKLEQETESKKVDERKPEVELHSEDERELEPITLFNSHSESPKRNKKKRKGKSFQKTEYDLY